MKAQNFFSSFLPLFASGLLLLGCGSEKVCSVDSGLSGTEINLEIERLENDLLDVRDRPALRKFMEDNPVIAEHFLKKSQYPHDSILIETLFMRFQNPYIDSLQMEIERVFGDLSDLERQFRSAFAHLLSYYPDFKVPKIKTVASGFEHDLFISDSLIVIGLDYYLGEGAKFRPLNLFEYVLRRYTPKYIVPSCMLLYGISPNFNRTDPSDKTILADMISYGKAFYFAKAMLPCTPDSVLIWYSEKEIREVNANRDIVWAHFVENEIFYQTNHLVKRKYIKERPKTYEIGEKAPGRIGTWLGWDIVKKYMDENPKVSLPELMQTANPQAIFKASNYKPR